MFYKKAVLNFFQYSQENTGVAVSFQHLCCWSWGLQLYQKEISTQVFFRECWKIFKNVYFEENMWTAAFE